MNEERENPDDDQEKFFELYVKEEADLSKRDLSNVENLDKAILSLSSAGLGLSLVFIRRRSQTGRCLPCVDIIYLLGDFCPCDYFNSFVVPFWAKCFKQAKRVQ